jgi:hypothetical protein
LSAAELGQQVEYLQAELGGLLEERYQLQVNGDCATVWGDSETDTCRICVLVSKT